MVEHVLAKDGVASSNLVFRSNISYLRRRLSAPLLFAIPSVDPISGRNRVVLDGSNLLAMNAVAVVNVDGDVWKCVS